MIDVKRLDETTYNISISGTAEKRLLAYLEGLTAEETIGFILAEALNGWDWSSYNSNEPDDDVPF